MSNHSETARALQALLQDRQTDRILRLAFPHKNGPDAVMLANALDAVETMSADFHFKVEVLSSDARIELKEVQSKMVTVSLVREDGSLRHFNGYVFEFRLVRVDGGLAYYAMVLKPWVAYLRLRKDNYLFHGLSLYEQTREIFRDYRINDWQTRVTGPDEPVTEAVQYAESDYNFIHRHWEAKGWHYWYEHRADGHTLVLGDDTLLARPIDGSTDEIPWQREAGSEEDDGIGEWTPVRRVMPTHVAFSSFDFKRPRPVVMDVPTINQQGHVPGLEVYEYTGAYGFKDHADGKKQVRQRMEELEARGKHFEASGNDRFVMPGRSFKLTGHYDLKAAGRDGDNEFLIVSARHRVRNNYLQGSGAAASYDNALDCIRKKIPWRPGVGFNSEQPRIYGLQTAIVVGPPGMEIYTDEFGRVRVQYHWDRVGKMDAASSAWVRVASPWTGDGYGFVGIPRVGQEVVVQFLDGNPDRPIVTSCIYNQRNPPPWGMPAASHQTGIRSRSTPGGKGHCELVIHDRAGQELVNIFSQKDMVTTVLNDQSTTVNRNQSTAVHGAMRTVQVSHGAQETTVKQHIKIESLDSDIHIKAATAITLEVGASKIVLDKDGNITITGKTLTSIATDAHTVKGAKLHLNPPGEGGAPNPAGALAAVAVEVGGVGGGATSSSPPDRGAAPFETGLGADVDALAAKSPSLQRDLRKLEKERWLVAYGPAKGGSEVKREKRLIVIDGAQKGNAPAVTQSLAHEVGHATNELVENRSSKAAYLDATLSDEGAATLNNIKVQREIISEGGENIGIAGNPANHAAYNQAYEKYLRDGDVVTARRTIGSQFGKSEFTSTTGQSYEDYYGSWYDENVAAKK